MQTTKTVTGDRVFRLEPALGPLSNPLKGWCPYTDDENIYQPYSLTYQYVSWRELEPTPGKYRFEEWEKQAWEKPAARNKQVIFRVYLDYPGKQAGVPQWLIDRGVRLTPYKDYGGGFSPDYNNPELQAALIRLIAALGQRYDGNPRVAFVQMGFLGFWGEWHTYPRTELFASKAMQQRVLEAAHRAFPRTLLMTRYPDGFAGTQSWMGFFDDMFPDDTDGKDDWKFLPKMRQSGRMENWKRAPIGGEMVPNAAKRLLGPDFLQTRTRLEAAHFSWMGPYCPPLEKISDPQFIARSQQMVRRMGYEFRLDTVRYANTPKAGRPLTLHFTGKNTGVAPFYYPWPLEIALLDTEKTVRKMRRVPVDIRAWLPGAFGFSGVVTLPEKPGNYTLVLRIASPYKNGPPLRFANALPPYQDWTRLFPLTL